MSFLHLCGNESCAVFDDNVHRDSEHRIVTPQFSSAALQRADRSGACRPESPGWQIEEALRQNLTKRKRRNHRSYTVSESRFN